MGDDTSSEQDQIQNHAGKLSASSETNKVQGTLFRKENHINLWWGMLARFDRMGPGELQIKYQITS